MPPVISVIVVIVCPSRDPTEPSNPSSTERLAGKVALVVGASSGIGAAAVLRFAAEGASVVAAARRVPLLEDLVQRVEAESGRAACVGCDVRDEESVANAVDVAVKRFGRLDVAFNNAGHRGSAMPITELPPDALDDAAAVNLRGTALCLKHEVRAMRERRSGAIVNTSSSGGLVANPVLPDYGATKAAVNHLTRSAAIAYARDGIRVNAIAPGPTLTEMLQEWLPTEEQRAALASTAPLPFIAMPDDIARAAVFLLSDEARLITGHVLPIDGGAAAA